MTERVCIAGATGHLGVAVVEELCSRDIPVVAVAQNSVQPNVTHLAQLGATIKFVDASHESYGTALISGVTTCISCLAAGYKNVDETSDFWAIDRDANIRFGREALRAGVKHLLLVSTFEGRDSRCVSAFSAAKEEAVDTLRREYEKKGAKLTVLRPNAYFKDLTDGAFDSVVAENKHNVLGDGTHKINPIAREDVAIFIADCVQKKNVPGRDYPLGGPDIFTFREIGVLAAQVTGNEETLTVRRIPLWFLRATALGLDLLGWWSSSVRRHAALVHWMIYVSSHDAVAPCHGKRRLRDEYTRKFKLYTEQQKSLSVVATSETPKHHSLLLISFFVLVLAVVWMLFRYGTK